MGWLACFPLEGGDPQRSPPHLLMPRISLAHVQAAGLVTLSKGRHMQGRWKLEPQALAPFPCLPARAENPEPSSPPWPEPMAHLVLSGEGSSLLSMLPVASQGPSCCRRLGNAACMGGSGTYRGCHFVPVCHKGTESFTKQGASHPVEEAAMSWGKEMALGARLQKGQGLREVTRGPATRTAVR